MLQHMETGKVLDEAKTERGEPAGRPGSAAIVRAVLLFACGFAATAAAIHGILGDPMKLYAADRSEKFALLAQSPEPYSTLFFGTSHVNQGFDPRAFDQGSATGGKLAGRSFDMGVDGGSQVEQRAMVLEVLQHPPQGGSGVPCAVMLEATGGPTFSELFTSHPRQINILDWRSLQLALQFHPQGWTRTYWLHRGAISALAMFYHEINMGMLSNLIFRPPLNQALMADESEDDRRGVHFEPSLVMSQQDVDKFFAARKYPPEAVPKDLGPGPLMEIEDLHKAPHGAQVRWMWVTMPELDDMQRYYVLPASEATSFGPVPILDMARPDLYPELYERSLWLDDQHFNERGAAVFSRLLAKVALSRAQSGTATGCGG